MLHRIALVFGGLAAAAVLAIGLAALGLSPTDPAADAANASIAADTTSTEVTPAAARTRTVVDTIYVRPAAKPAVIHVTKVDRSSKAVAAPRHKVTNGKRNGNSGEGDDNGGERDDNGGGEGHGEGGDD